MNDGLHSTNPKTIMDDYSEGRRTGGRTPGNGSASPTPRTPLSRPRSITGLVPPAADRRYGGPGRPLLLGQVMPAARHVVPVGHVYSVRGSTLPPPTMPGGAGAVLELTADGAGRGPRRRRRRPSTCRSHATGARSRPSGVCRCRSGGRDRGPRRRVGLGQERARALAARSAATQPPPAVTGSAVVCGLDMVTADPEQRRVVRRDHLGAVFQDPMTSLNPTMPVGRQVAEAAGSGAEAVRLLDAVGVPDPVRRAERSRTSFPAAFANG